MGSTGFKITDPVNGWNRADFNDVFINKDCFIEGNLFIWGGGSQNEGIIGDNTRVNKSSPVQTISGGTNWKDVSVGSLTAGGIKTDGTLWLWGRGSNGELGNNALTNRSSPVQTVSGGTDWKKVSISSDQVFGIKTDGSLWSWGLNVAGVLGHNNVTSRSSPVQVVGDKNNWKSVSAGTGRSIAAIKTDGTLWLWGSGTLGRLGTEDVINRSSPVQTVSTATTWKNVSSGNYSTVAIKTDGTLWLWGLNNYGQLGVENRISVSSPVQTISGGTNWKNASFGDRLVAAVKNDGSLWTWGHNSCGGLGDGTINHASSPVQTVSGGTNWRCVDVGNFRMTAIKTDGTLWGWGRNSGLGAGALGDNTIVDKSSPVQILSSTQWSKVQTDNNATIAIKDT